MVLDGAPRMRHLLCLERDAGWSSLVARRAHNPKVPSSNLGPATIFPDTYSAWRPISTFLIQNEEPSSAPTATTGQSLHLRLCTYGLNLWRSPCCPKSDRRGSCGVPIVVVQHPAQARATGDLAICPVVIRRSDLLSDELATDALVEPLGHIVLNEFLDQVAQMSLAEDDEVIEALVLDGFYKALRVWIAIPDSPGP